jgi:hypothetical protein
MTSPIVIWEPNPSGHRLSYVRYLAQWLQSNQIPFIIGSTEDSLKSPQWDKQGLDEYPYLLASGLVNFSKILPEQFNKATVIIPDCDNKIIELLRNFKTLKKHKFSLLVMRPRPIDGRFGRLKFLLKIGTLGLIKTFYRNTRIFSLSSPGLKLPVALKTLQTIELLDPCEWAPGLSRRELGLNANHEYANIFLVAGELSSRKHLPELLSAWVSGIEMQNILVLVGTLSPTIDQDLVQKARTTENVIFVDGYIGNTEFDSWIDISNYVFVLHKNAGSSGVALKAAIGGTTIIVGGDNSIKNIVGQITTNFAICEPVTPEAIKALTYSVGREQSEPAHAKSVLILPAQWSKLLVLGTD